MLLNTLQDVVNHPDQHPLISKIISPGDLYVPTGKLAAYDPLYDFQWEVPFSWETPTGRYPVKLYYFYDENWGLRIALAAVIFKEEEIHTLEPASYHKKDFSFQDDNAYAVEAGMGCFADLDSARLYTQKINELREKQGKAFNHYDHFIEIEMQKNQEFDYLNLFPYPDKENNIIMFSSGIGDGYYNSYWGLDKKQNILCLLTDFKLLDGEYD